MSYAISPETASSADAQLRSVHDFLGRIDRRWTPGVGPDTDPAYLAEKAAQLVDAARRLQHDLELAAREAGIR